MIRRIARNRAVCMVLIFLVTGFSAPPGIYQAEITGDKISIDASQAPLRELLKRLSTDYGITVRTDPEINPLITVSFKNRDLEDGLKAILKPYNHIFIWKTNASSNHGSTGPGYILEEIHIFKAGQKDRMVNIQTPAPSQADEQSEPEDQSEAQTGSLSETRVIIKDNKVFVPVTLGYENNQIETTLIFDTGAGSIVLHADVAQKLGIEQGQVSQGEGVGGIRITTRTARLGYVEVGPYKKENLRVDIIDFEGNEDEDYNGLLGMNFIRGLKYTIDFDQQVIRWQR